MRPLRRRPRVRPTPRIWRWCSLGLYKAAEAAILPLAGSLSSLSPTHVASNVDFSPRGTTWVTVGLCKARGTRAPVQGVGTRVPGSESLDEPRPVIPCTKRRRHWLGNRYPGSALPSTGPAPPPLACTYSPPPLGGAAHPNRNRPQRRRQLGPSQRRSSRASATTPRPLARRCGGARVPFPAWLPRWRRWSWTRSCGGNRREKKGRLASFPPGRPFSPRSSPRTPAALRTDVGCLPPPAAPISRTEIHTTSEERPRRPPTTLSAPAAFFVSAQPRRALFRTVLKLSPPQRERLAVTKLFKPREVLLLLLVRARGPLLDCPLPAAASAAVA